MKIPKMTQIRTGQIFMLAGLVFTLVSSCISGVWILSQTMSKDLKDVNDKITIVDRRLARIEGFLSVSQPSLAEAEHHYTITHNINK